MQILTRIGLALAWFTGLALVFAAANKNDPYLTWLRGAGNAVVVVASLVVVTLMIRRGVWRGGGWPGRLLLLLWVLPPVAMQCAETSFEVRKWRVLNTDAARANMLGWHFVVGYASFDEVARLADRGLISGVYITRHNVAGAGGTACAGGAACAGAFSCPSTATGTAIHAANTKQSLLFTRHPPVN